MSDTDSEEANSSDFLDEFFCEESDQSNVSNDEKTITGLYNNEPEYSELELQVRNTTNNSDASDMSDSDSNSSRLENLHWCSCTVCVIWLTMTLHETKCCRECNILGEKLEGIKCITEHEDFNILCLNKTVLETACIRHRRYHNNFKDVKEFMNK